MEPKEKRQKAKRLLEVEGSSRKEVARILGVSYKTIGRWKDVGFEDPLKKRKSVINKRDWPKITAGDLVGVGFVQKSIPLILTSLEIAKEQGNDRLHRFFYAMIQTHNTWPHMPTSWTMPIAGLPIVSEDTDIPSLAKVAEIIETFQPHLSKEARREYHRKMKPVRRRLIVELQSYFLHDAKIGWVIIPEPTGAKVSSDESLDGRNIDVAYPKEQGSNINLGNTWPGILFDMAVNCLPDADRQQGKLRKKEYLGELLLTWFSIPVEDFDPPLPKMKESLAISRDMNVLIEFWKGKEVGD